MKIQFQIKYLEPKKIFMNELNDDYLQVRGQKDNNQPVLVAGTVTKINRANDFLAVFVLEDPTIGHVVEVFRDKLPFDTEIEVGMELILKGIYTKNKFDEKIIKAYRLQKVNINRLYMFYLEVLSEKKNQFNEEEYLLKKSKDCDLRYVGRQIEEHQGVRQIFSSIFTYLLTNYKKIQKQDCFLFEEQLMQLDEIKQLKDQIKEDCQFQEFYDKAVNAFQENNILAPFKEQKGYVVFVNFFQEFQEKFYADLEYKIYNSYSDNKNKETFQVKQVRKIMNSMLQENCGFLINEEAALQFIYNQILQKKMYYQDKKNQNLILFK